MCSQIKATLFQNLRLFLITFLFSEVNELDFSELDLPDIPPITFKFVNYPSREHPKGGNMAGQDYNRDDLEKLYGDYNREDLENLYGLTSKDAAATLKMGKGRFRRICRELGIHRWPQNEKNKDNPSRVMRESANETAGDTQQNTGSCSCSDHPPSDMPLHEDVPHAGPESSQGRVAQPKVDMVVIKAEYKDDTIRIELCPSAGLEKLWNEVGRRLNLTVGTFKLKYLDEDNEEILLACDDDLQQCFKSPAAVGKRYVKVFVQSI